MLYDTFNRNGPVMEAQQAFTTVSHGNNDKSGEATVLYSRVDSREDRSDCRILVIFTGKVSTSEKLMDTSFLSFRVGVVTAV